MSVVVGVDESDTSLAVLKRAAEQARMRGEDLQVVHVAQVPLLWADMPVNPRTVMEGQRAAVWSVIEPVMATLDVASQKVDLEGYPPDELVRFASETSASVLVVGTRGRGEIASLVLGSTSHRAIHEAACDVLVVKTPT